MQTTVRRQSLKFQTRGAETSANDCSAPACREFAYFSGNSRLSQRGCFGQNASRNGQAMCAFRKAISVSTAALLVASPVHLNATQMCKPTLNIRDAVVARFDQETMRRSWSAKVDVNASGRFEVAF